jgi:hypothetical protein
MKSRILLLVSITICLGFTLTYAQTSRGALTPPPAPKLDSTGRLQSSSPPILQDLCAQSVVVKSKLPAATRQKALAAIEAVRISWRSAPGKVDALNLARSEVRRIFGSRARNVEDVLVCHVFGEALRCGENTAEATSIRHQVNPTAFESFDQKSNQLFNLLSTIIKNIKEMDQSIIRNIQ